VANKNAALLHRFFQVSNAQRISCVPAGAHQHHLQWIVQSLEHLAQLGDHRIRGHVLHSGIFNAWVLITTESIERQP
jgi:hypothetical protein